MPKILRRVVETPMFEEPDHSPEISAQESYEEARAGVKLRGVPGPDDGLEIPTETPMRLDPGRGWDAPALIEELDPYHDCDQPAHAEWAIRWCVEHGWPPPRDYTTCRGYRRLRARHVTELSGNG